MHVFIPSEVGLAETCQLGACGTTCLLDGADGFEQLLMPLSVGFGVQSYFRAGL